MSFARWLRANSEHYLLVAAQGRVARRYGTLAPQPPRGLKELFWLRIFAPLYRMLPWPLRRKIMLAMPGSHRRTWAPPPTAQGSAVQSLLPRNRTPQQKESSDGTDRR